MEAGGCKARHSGAMVSSSSPDRKWWLCSTSSMRPLNRSTIPLVCGDLGGVSRCSIPRVEQSMSNSCCPVATRFRRPKRRSVNSFPLSVKMVRIWIGHARSRSRRRRQALAAVLLRYTAVKTQQLALSIATKRYPHDVSLAICGRYFMSMWMYPGSYA